MGMTDAVIKKVLGRPKDFWITPKNVKGHADRLAVFIREYAMNRAGKKGVVIGMSGGLDSAVVGALCARAQVPVFAAVLPYGKNMVGSGSHERAMEMIREFKWEHLVFDIEPACTALMEGPNSNIYKRSSIQDIRLAHINLRARVRVVKLRELAQLNDYLLLGTDNLTELILGYFAKDGNGCDLRPCKLLTKREMYTLAPAVGVVRSIIDAVPSAELEEGQTDEGDLGFSYMSADTLIGSGSTGDWKIDQQIYSLIASTQHKRAEPMCYAG